MFNLTYFNITHQNFTLYLQYNKKGMNEYLRPKTRGELLEALIESIPCEVLSTTE